MLITDECTELPPVEGLSTATKFPIPYGTLVTVSCEVAYNFAGDTMITCLKDQQFSHYVEPTCNPSKGYLTIMKLKTLILYIIEDCNLNNHELDVDDVG